MALALRPTPNLPAPAQPLIFQGGRTGVRTKRAIGGRDHSLMSGSRPKLELTRPIEPADPAEPAEPPVASRFELRIRHLPPLFSNHHFPNQACDPRVYTNFSGSVKTKPGGHDKNGFRARAVFLSVIFTISSQTTCCTSSEKRHSTPNSLSSCDFGVCVVPGTHPHECRVDPMSIALKDRNAMVWQSSGGSSAESC